MTLVCVNHIQVFACGSRPILCGIVITQVYKLEEDAPVRLVDVLTLQGHDDIVSSVAASRSHDGLVLSGSYDRRYLIVELDVFLLSRRFENVLFLHPCCLF